MGEYNRNTVSSRIAMPIATALAAAVSAKVAIDKKEGFFGISSELNDGEAKMYAVFASLIACWFLYELVVSVCFFVYRYNKR